MPKRKLNKNDTHRPGMCTECKLYKRRVHRVRNICYLCQGQVDRNIKRERKLLAAPIQATPILYGKDAINFVKEMQKTESRHSTKKERFLAECIKIAKEVKREVN